MNDILKENLIEGGADLHLHTIASDGTYTSSRMVENAKSKNYTTIAITDHDTTDGVDEAVETGKKLGVEVIAGTELTVEYNECEMHILGYFINKDNKAFQQTLKELREIRMRRAKEMAAKLEMLGFKIPLNSIIRENHDSAIGRLHIANLLISEGHVASIEEAMARFLRKGKPAYVPKKRLHPAEGIGLIHKIGGIAVLAHPGLGGLEKFLPDLIRFGLNGIEAFHSKHTNSQTEMYIKIAAEQKLLITGGSDCHGKGKEKELLGLVNLPKKYLDALKEFHKGKICSS